MGNYNYLELAMEPPEDERAVHCEACGFDAYLREGIDGLEGWYECVECAWMFLIKEGAAL